MFEPTPASQAINKIRPQPQAQYALLEQIRELEIAATRLGLYDAADLLRFISRV